MNDEHTSEFLNEAGIDKERNIFKRVDIEKDWQKAVGFLLSEYASAYESKRISPKSLKEIPTSIAVVYEGSSNKTITHNAKLTPLLSKVSSKIPNINNVLTEWLCHAYITNEQDLEVILKILTLVKYWLISLAIFMVKTFKYFDLKIKQNLTNLLILSCLKT
jgi:hypothetical protein